VAEAVAEAVAEERTYPKKPRTLLTGSTVTEEAQTLLRDLGTKGAALFPTMAEVVVKCYHRLMVMVIQFHIESGMSILTLQVLTGGPKEL